MPKRKQAEINLTCNIIVDLQRELVTLEEDYLSARCRYNDYYQQVSAPLTTASEQLSNIRELIDNYCALEKNYRLLSTTRMENEYQSIANSALKRTVTEKYLKALQNIFTPTVKALFTVRLTSITMGKKVVEFSLGVVEGRTQTQLADDFQRLWQELTTNLQELQQRQVPKLSSGSKTLKFSEQQELSTLPLIDIAGSQEKLLIIYLKHLDVNKNQIDSATLVEILISLKENIEQASQMIKSAYPTIGNQSVYYEAFAESLGIIGNIEATLTRSQNASATRFTPPPAIEIPPPSAVVAPVTDSPEPSDDRDRFTGQAPPAKYPRITAPASSLFTVQGAKAQPTYQQTSQAILTGFAKSWQRIKSNYPSYSAPLSGGQAEGNRNHTQMIGEICTSLGVVINEFIEARNTHGKIHIPVASGAINEAISVLRNINKEFERDPNTSLPKLKLTLDQILVEFTKLKLNQTQRVSVVPCHLLPGPG